MGGGEVCVQSSYEGLTKRLNDAEKREARRVARRGNLSIPQSLWDMEISEKHETAVAADMQRADVVRSASPDSYNETDSNCTNSNAAPSSISSRAGASGSHLAYPLPSAPGQTGANLRTVRDIFVAKGAGYLYKVEGCGEMKPGKLVFETSRSSVDEEALEHAPEGEKLEQEFLYWGGLEQKSDFVFAVLGDDSTVGAAPHVDVSFREGSVHLTAGDVLVDLWRPSVMSSLRHLIDISEGFAGFRKAGSQAPLPTKLPEGALPSRTSIVPQDIMVWVAFTKIRVRLAGTDPKFESTVARGLSVQADKLLLELFHQTASRPGIYTFPERQRLDLTEDIRVQAHALWLQNPAVDAAFVKVTAALFTVTAVPDMSHALNLLRSARSDGTLDLTEDLTWELRNRPEFSADYASTTGTSSGSASPRPMEGERPPPGVGEKLAKISEDLVKIPGLSFRATIQTERNMLSYQRDRLIVAVHVPAALTSHLDIFHAYCSLLALSNVKTLFSRRHVVRRSPTPVSPRRRPLDSEFKVEIKGAHILAVPSKEAPIFLELNRVEINYAQNMGVNIALERLFACGRSVTNPGKWDDILVGKAWELAVFNQPDNDGSHPFVIRLAGDAIRLRIPFKFVLSEIVESIGTCVKTLKQLAHQFLKGGYDSVLQPQAEDAKKVPEISIVFRIVVVQAEDDPFENRLSVIRRVGNEEVKSRLTRSEAFESRVAQMNGDGSTDDSSSEASFSPPPSSASGSISFDDASIISSTFSDEYDQPPGEVPVEEARYRLNAFDATEYTMRIRNAIASQGRQEDIIRRQMYGHTSSKHYENLPLDILPPTRLTPLARVVFTEVDLTLSAPSFGEEGLSDYLYDVGKGLPRDTKFTLLLPLRIRWKMQGATCRLRDFPLYLLHMPKVPETSDEAVWSMDSDFVIAEEMGGPDSIRWCPGVVVPRHLSKVRRPYVVQVPRTIMSVKMYAVPMITVNAPGPVRLGWGNSMQPAIQDLMRVIDTFSKPPADPSPRVGFWDKVRLVLHWRIMIRFEGDTQVVLHLKGSRDPYELLGPGAGFAMMWRGNVHFLVGHENTDQEFFQIKSDECILGIPNLRDFIDTAAEGAVVVDNGNEPMQDSTTSLPWSGHTNRSRTVAFFKIMAKLTNGVRWGMGIALERTCDDSLDYDCSCTGSAFHRNCRFFTFKPHYNLALRSPEAVLKSNDPLHDSFRGFRSDFIHFSLSIRSPTRASSEDHDTDEIRQNSFHFAPEASTHFWAWCKTFDSSLSLPIRVGKLFPSSQGPSKKFGRHIATLKYYFSISPLYFAHTYRQDSDNDWLSGQSNIVGVKARIDQFNVDLHQRAVETTVRKPEMKEPKKIIHKAFYRAEIDCANVEIRALSANFHCDRKASFAATTSMANSAEDSEASPPPPPEPLSARDRKWLDMDDFVDLLFVSPSAEPSVRFYDCITCPKVSYIRQPSNISYDAASIGGSGDTDQSHSKTKFGDEATHTCLVGTAKHALVIQLELLFARTEELAQEIRGWADAQPSKATTQKLQELRNRKDKVDALITKAKYYVDRYLNRHEAHSDAHATGTSAAASGDWEGEEVELEDIVRELSDPDSHWANRLLIHSPSILISNLTRDLLLKYYLSSRERKGFMYHISARAVKFIIDLQDIAPESVSKPKQETLPHRRKHRLTRSVRAATGTSNVSDFMEKIMVAGNENEADLEGPPGTFLIPAEELAEKDLPDNFLPEFSDLVLLMRPQIAFKSEVDDSSTVVLSAFHSQLKSFNVFDAPHLDDPVNARVLRRSFLTISGFQAFHPNEAALSPDGQPREYRLWHHNLVPVEVLVDRRLEPWGFDRLIPRTSVSVRYDKFNQLRIKKRSVSDDSSFAAASQDHLRTNTDWLKVDADSLSVHANPEHYRAIYNVVTDLCLYTDPSQKERNAAIETMLFAFGVDDLSGMVEAVRHRQMLIRNDRRALVAEYASANPYDSQGTLALTEREFHLWRQSSDLNLLVQAIQRSQAHRSPGKVASAAFQLNAFAKSIAWHMMGEGDEPIAKLSVSDSKYERRSLADTSVSNRLDVGNLVALNVSAEHSVFDEILSKIEDPQHHFKGKSILSAVWNTLPPVGGIPIVDQFEAKLHPMKVQIEHALGAKMHDYVFSTNVNASSDANVLGKARTPTRAAFPGGGERSSMARSNSSRSVSSTNSRVRTISTGNRPASITSNGSDETPPLALRSQDSLASNASSVTNRTGRSASGSFLRPNWRSRAQATPASGSPPKVKVERAKLAGGGEGGTMLLTSLAKRDNKDADEMKRRAREYRTFVMINFEPSVFQLSYVGGKYPNVFGLQIQLPAIKVHSQTWSYGDLFTTFTSTITSSLIRQTPRLLTQFVTTARKNKALPKMMGKKVAGGLGNWKNRIVSQGSKGMAKRAEVAELPEAEAEAEAAAEAEAQMALAAQGREDGEDEGPAGGHMRFTVDPPSGRGSPVDSDDEHRGSEWSEGGRPFRYERYDDLNGHAGKVLEEEEGMVEEPVAMGEEEEELKFEVSGNRSTSFSPSQSTSSAQKFAFLPHNSSPLSSPSKSSTTSASYQQRQRTVSSSTTGSSVDRTLTLSNYTRGTSVSTAGSGSENGRMGEQGRRMSVGSDVKARIILGKSFVSGA